MRRPARRLPVLRLALGIMVAGGLVAGGGGGCAPRDGQAEEGEGGGAFVRGRARVVSVNPAIGLATLEIDGERVQAYWELERMQAQGGAIVRSGPLKPAVGDYREPIVHTQEFPAQAGDVILFVAMKTGRNLFLRGVQVVGR